jgi:hypothetical protein
MRPFRGATDHQESRGGEKQMAQTPESVKLNAKGKPLNFQSIGQEPLLWGYQAQNLKRVADNAFQLAKEDLKNMLTAWDRVDLIY